MRIIGYKAISNFGFFIRPILKFGIGGGVIYFAVDQGLFSADQNETINATKKVSELLPNMDSYTKNVSKYKFTKEELISYWNYGVKATFSTLFTLPEDSKKLVTKGFNYAKDELSKQMKTTAPEK